MANEPSAPPVESRYCDSCGERTATPPLCADCRVGTVDDIAARSVDGRWRAPSDVQWLVAEVGRLRGEVAARGEQLDEARAERDGLREALRLSEVREASLCEVRDQLQALRAEERAERDRLTGQVQRVEAWAADRIGTAMGRLYAIEVRAALGAGVSADEFATAAVRAAAAGDMDRYFELLHAYDDAVAAEDAARDGAR